VGYRNAGLTLQFPEEIAKFERRASKSMRTLPIAVILAIMGVTGIAIGVTYLGVTYLEEQSQMASLLSQQVEVSDLGKRLGVYQNIAAHQEEMAHSLRLELRDSIDDSIGDRLVVTEAIYEDLPKNIVEARAQGYVLLDTVDSEGELIEAACFAHESARHYAKQDSRITDGVKWHGAPLLLIYNSNSEKLIGMVLESTSHQTTPLWEYHAKGHPGMDFAHWSLHFWFTEPPENLSLGHQPN